MSTAARVAIALALAASYLAPTQAHAVKACVNNFDLRFTPPLKFDEEQIGVVTIDFEVQCPDLPGHPGDHYTGQSTAEYAGSCVYAIFTEGTRTVLIGSTVYLYLAGHGSKALLLQPEAQCAPGAEIGSAHGTGVEVAYP